MDPIVKELLEHFSDLLGEKDEEDTVWVRETRAKLFALGILPEDNKPPLDD